MTDKGKLGNLTVARALALAMVVGLLGCESVTFTSARWEAVQAELLRRYALWKAAAPARYEYRFNRVCECPADLTREVIVEVMDTTVVAVTYTDGSGMAPASAFASYFTVEGLFRQIQFAINSLADSLRIRYDDTLNYPTLIIGDLNVLVVDDELELYATELVAK